MGHPLESFKENTFSDPTIEIPQNLVSSENITSFIIDFIKANGFPLDPDFKQTIGDTICLRDSYISERHPKIEVLLHSKGNNPGLVVQYLYVEEGRLVLDSDHIGVSSFDYVEHAFQMLGKHMQKENLAQLPSGSIVNINWGPDIIIDGSWQDLTGRRTNRIRAALGGLTEKGELNLHFYPGNRQHGIAGMLTRFAQILRSQLPSITIHNGDSIISNGGQEA